MNKILTVVTILLVSLVAQNTDDLLIEGKKLLNDGFVLEAQNKLLAVVEADPAVAEAHFLLSKIYLRQYDLDKTRESLRKAIDNDQTNQEYRDEFDHLTALASSMASAMRALNGGDPEGAIAKFEKVNEDYAEYSAAGMYLSLIHI